MSKSLHWIIPHASGILAALLLGPLLSGLAWVEFFSIPLTAVTGANAVRLVTQEERCENAAHMRDDPVQALGHDLAGKVNGPQSNGRRPRVNELREMCGDCA